MKIFYGVQATGNGHITRARILGRALEAAGARVTWLFSGRPPEKLFDMEAFGNYQTCKGLTFVTKKGRIDPLKTAANLSFPTFFRDIRALDLSDFDCIISDFEPVTAWHCRFHGLPCLGISHQSAFTAPIPLEGARPLQRLVMRCFAPCTTSVGLHWHPFGPNILPPIIDTERSPEPPAPGKILVYLPFEERRVVEKVLAQTGRARYTVYCDINAPRDRGNLHLRPFSRTGFQKDLATCQGVISSAGFELASEAIHLGKKLLVKPVDGQMEQLSNARALELLGFATRMERLAPHTVAAWLDAPVPAPCPFPDTASELAHWITRGRTEKVDLLSRRLWARATRRDPRRPMEQPTGRHPDPPLPARGFTA